MTPDITVSTVQIGKLRHEAISIHFLKIPPEPVKKKPETKRFCVLTEYPSRMHLGLGGG